MNSLVGLLVVEDDERHMADFLETLLEVKRAMPFQIILKCAANLEEALKLIPEADLVVTDVFFPDAPGQEVGAYGTNVVAECLKQLKPVVWITSTYHHGDETEESSKWGRDHGLEMFDCSPRDGIGEALHKPWKRALYGVVALAVGIEQGAYAIKEGRILMCGTPASHNPSGEYPLGSELNNLVWTYLMERSPVARKMYEMGIGR